MIGGLLGDMSPAEAALGAILFGIILWILGRFVPSLAWARQIRVVLTGTVSGAVLASVIGLSDAVQGAWTLVVGAASTLTMSALVYAMFRDGLAPVNPENAGRSFVPDKIFVSYRRSDAAFATDRICERLRARFGKSRVVQDVDSIPKGVDFRLFVKGEVERCAVLVAIVGDRWVTVETSEGTRRLDDPNDMVRLELELAKEAGLRVIPVTLGTVTMPAKHDLPAELAWFSDRNAARVDAGRQFQAHVSELIESIEDTLGDRQRWWSRVLRGRSLSRD